LAIRVPRSIRLLELAAAILLLIAACTTGTAPTSAPPAPTGSPPSATESSLVATPTPTTTAEVTPMPTPPPFTLTATAFAAGGSIPREYSCDGADVSPALAWTGVPTGAKALVLVVDDPDAGNFLHWSVLDLPGADGGLPRGVSPAADPPQQGRNAFGRTGWGGPCPPSGTHHYRFTLTAIAAPLGLAGHPDGSTVRAALARATALGGATLIGTYRRG
jgi:Raf kinase inhibitor-like YbhB/YbcL family protein